MVSIGKGRQAEVYAVNTSECLKLFYEDVPLHVIEREAAIMRYISTLPIPVPKFIRMFEHEGRHGICMERLYGCSMLEDTLKDPQKIEEDGETMGRIQRKYHQIKAEGLGRMTDGMIWSIKETALLSKEEKETLLDGLSKMPVGDRLVHMDYHADNLMITSDGVKIIDWSGAACGNPLADAARTLMTCSTGSYPVDATPELCAMLDQFRKVFKTAYLHGYGIQEEELDGWKPFVAAARLFCAPQEEQKVDLEIVREYLAR